MNSIKAEITAFEVTRQTRLLAAINFRFREEIVKVVHEEFDFLVQAAVIGFIVNVRVKSFFVQFLQRLTSLH